MRFVAIALVVLAAGCADDTVLRIDIPDPGTSPAPTSLRVTLVGVNAPSRTIAPVTFPGTIVVTHVPSSVAQLCVDVEGLDDAGDVVVGGASLVAIAAHATARTTVSLSTADQSCATITPDDLALGGPDDLAGGDGASGGDLAGADMKTGDLAQVQICPAGSLFCDDFETGDLGKWTSTSIKQAGDSVAVQTNTKAHGTYALQAIASGAAGASVYAEAVKVFTPTAPPLALRANVYFPTTLAHFDHVIALYENNASSTNEFSIGGDDQGYWVVSENEALAPDERSDMVPTDAGKWHCVELVIDPAGMVTLYVDNHKLIGPWARVTTGISYSTLLVGVTRSVDANYTAYIDDVAVGPSRLYCPP